MKTYSLVPVVLLVLVILVMSVFVIGCKPSAVQSDAEKVIGAANIIINASQNYKDWGADLTALIQVLELAGADVPTKDKELAAYLVAVAEAIKAITAGKQQPVAAIIPLGADVAAPARPLPRTKADAERWARAVTTPDPCGRTALSILSQHVEDKSLLRAFHVEPR